MRKFLLWPALILSGLASFVFLVLFTPLLAVMRTDRRQRDLFEDGERMRWVGYDDDDPGTDVDGDHLS